MFLFESDILTIAKEAINAIAARHYKLALAESCTGGLVTSALVSVPGASTVIDRGFITYSNEAKAQVLMVNPDTLLTHGAVSTEVASDMACNARRLSHSNIGLSITGIAGPDGGTAEKPVGLVYFGLSIEDHEIIVKKETFGQIGRDDVRMKSVVTALKLLRDHV